MAPSPEPQGTEPKAPDKSSNQSNDNNRKDFNSTGEVSDCNTSDDIEMKSLSGSPDDKQEASDVSDLNDGQLKALLDEAYNYKSPKDRVGKSEIFKKFLQEAETAESEGGAEKGLLFAEAPGARSAGGGSKRRSGRREAGRAVSEGQSRCGSLQNLSQCHVEPWQLLHHAPNCSSSSSSSRRSRHGPSQFRRGASTSSTCSSVASESVSTRQREGGSLPCSVDAVHDLQRCTVSGCCPGDDHHGVPSLQDLTIWHSNYSFRGNSMPKLPSPAPSSSPSPMEVVAGRSVSPPPQEVLPVETIRTRIPPSPPPGFHKVPQVEEVTTELIARVEAVKSEKQVIREAADQVMETTQYSYCSNYQVQLGGPPSKSQVDEPTDFPCLNTKVNSSSSGSEGSVPPLQLKECDAVCSVMGGNNRQTDSTLAAGAAIKSNSVVRAEVPPSTTLPPTQQQQQRKQVVYATTNTSRLFYSAPDQETNPMFHGSKVLVPATTKLDENGNALRGDSGDNTTQRTKKKHKDKSLPTSLSEHCEGYRGNEELNDLLYYIEGGKAEGSAQQGKQQAKQKRSKEGMQQQQQQEAMGRRSQRHSEEGSENGKRGGSKGKERQARNKMQRANSMEEVSRTKMEDLTGPPESSRSVGDGRTSQASMLDDFDDMQQDLENGNVASYKEVDSSGFKEDFYSVIEASSQHTKQDGEEFYVVTKKQRRRKQRGRQDDHPNRSGGYQRRGGDFDEDDDSSLNSGFAYRSYHPHQKDRRKCKSTSSMPPSDQSGGESSDLDSVHSLPVSSSTKPGNSGAAQASYADITRASVPADMPNNNIVVVNNVSKPSKPVVKKQESWDDWPQPPVAKPERKDVDPPANPTVSITSTSSVSSISPASSTISSSNATEPNTPPEEPTRVNVLQDFPPLIPSLTEHPERRKAEENELRKPPELENNNNPVVGKNKTVINRKQQVVSNDELKHNEYNSTDSLKHNNINMVNGVDHLEPQEKVVKFNDYKARMSTTITKPPAFVCNPHHQHHPSQQQQQQQPPAVPPAAVATAVQSPAAVPMQQLAPESQQPAVILLNETQRSDSSSDISGLTFGFEINELLLAQVEPELADSKVTKSDSVTQAQEKSSSSSSSSSSTVVLSLPCPDSSPSSSEPSAVDTAGEVSAPSPPPPPVPLSKTKDFVAMFRVSSLPDPTSYNSSDIIEFVGQAWGKILRELESGQPIKYYSEV